MKKIITLFFIAFPAMVMANSGTHLDHAPIDLTDNASLQRGAKSFAQNCMGCHSAEYMRYNRIAQDLGMTEAEVTQSMIFTRNKDGERTKAGALMEIAMDGDFAKAAFGTKVPGLTVIARARGADWLYTYLRTFYQDDSRPMGMNNIVFPKVGMPHVLWELQGIQKAVFKTETDHEGNAREVFEKMEIVTPGTMSTEEYDAFVADLVNFLVYMGEPIQQERKELGVYVLIFLFFFAIIAYMLKKEYWKDVH